jgi:hypothetical protein
MSDVIDLNYRPATYFRPQKLRHYLRSKVKGAALRREQRALLETESEDDLVKFLADLARVPADLGAVHPMFMGGNYLPDTGEGEVEIGRISIKSVLYDVTCVYARMEAGLIHYRVVDEYDGDTLQGVTEKVSDKPMTLGEFADFFLGAWPLIDVLEMNLENGWTDAWRLEPCLKWCLDFFTAESAFYPDFGLLCRERVIEHFTSAEKYLWDEDEEED